MMKKVTLLIIISVWFSGLLHSQNQTFKETKSIQFQEKYKEGDRIIILGERTFINLKSWNKNSVDLKAKVISRYKDQSQAKADLEKIDLNFGKSGKKIVYSNAIRISNPKSKPLSNLKVEIEVWFR